MTTENVPPKEAFEQTGQALLRGVSELAKLHPEIAGNDAAKAFITVFFPIVGLALGRGTNRLAAGRLPQFAGGYAKAFHGDYEKVEEHAKVHQDEPNYYETMYRSFRQMMDAAEPEVVEAIGYLASQYTLAGKKPDSHFRRLGRVLSDLESGDLADLRKLLHGVLAFECTLKSFGDAALRIGQQSNVSTPNLVVEVEVGDDFHELGHLRSAERLFMLLKRDGLGSNLHGGMGMEGRTLASGDETITIAFATARAVLATIDPQS